MASVKFFHLVFVTLSISGFILRAVWALLDSPILRHRATRVIPHINDTLLLGTGLWMVIETAQYPHEQHWLTAKLVALLVYIGLGMVVLRPGNTPATRLLALALAITCYAYMLAVALSRSPTAWFA